jgi:hypothetical protein
MNMRSRIVTALTFCAAIAFAGGCGGNLSLYNPDGSLNTINQVQMLHRNYLRMTDGLNEPDISPALKYLVTIEQLATLLPEVPGNAHWNDAKATIITNLSGMKASLRLGDPFATKDFAGKMGSGVQMIWTLAPTLFDKGGKPLTATQPATLETAPVTPSPPAPPTGPARPAGLYDR